MKKLIAIGITILMLLNITAISYADERSTDKTIPVQLQVGSEFGFEVWDSQLVTQILKPNGGLVPDPTPEDPDHERDERLGNINMIVTTNQGGPWAINAECPGMFPTGQTGYGIPLVISTFEGANPLSGTTVDNLELTSTDQYIYLAGDGEWSVRNFEVVAVFLAKPNIPIAAGTYDGYILLTMVGPHSTPPGPPPPPQ